MSDRKLQSPVTGGQVVKSEKDAQPFLDQGWVDVTDVGDAPKPTRGAPKPDLQAGRDALGKNAETTAAKASKASTEAKTAAGPKSTAKAD